MSAKCMDISGNEVAAAHVDFRTLSEEIYAVEKPARN